MARCEIRTAACLNVCASVLMNKVLGSWSCMHCTCTVYGSCFLTEMIAFTDKLTLLSYSRSLLAPRNQHCGGKNAKVEASIYGAQIQYVTSCWLHSYLQHISHLSMLLSPSLLFLLKGRSLVSLSPRALLTGVIGSFSLSLIRCVPYKAT